MKKRILSILIVLTIIVTAALYLPADAAAENIMNIVSGETFGDFGYEILGNGTVSITSYKGTAASVSVPAAIKGKTVTEIGYGAFAGSQTLTSVYLPESFKKIGSSAFAVCESLKTISIPSGVTYIGSDAFYLTPWITNYGSDFVIAGDGILVKYKGSSQTVNVPVNVNVIGIGAFSDSSQVRKVTIPDSVTVIDDLAFFWTDLEQVTIPTSVTKIGEMAFKGCVNLKTAVVPSTVKTIGSEAFINCPDITVKCRKGSAAEKHCKEYNIRYEASDGQDTPPAPKDNIPKCKGDIDGDGQITANDALLILRASVGLTELNEKQKDAADIDLDSNITANDALAVLRCSVGIQEL